MESKDVFLNDMKNKINEGAYDEQLTLPFMTKKLMIATLEGKIKKRLETGGTPMLTDAEIKNMIEEMKEASGSAFYLFVQYGILEKTETGYQLSKKGARALRESFKL